MKEKVDNLRTFRRCNLRVGISIVVLPRGSVFESSVVADTSDYGRTIYRTMTT